jgi:predicted O-methyltransferase YrrM
VGGVRNELGWRGRPLAGAIGLRAPVAEHADEEGRLLERFAKGALIAVEIGVAEGASARRLRSVIATDGTLYLVDPHPPGVIGISFTRMIARRAVRSVPRGSAVWVRRRSHGAAADWDQEIDFLFIDGDHSFEGVFQDWNEWSPYVKPGGHVALHDARVAGGSWAGPKDGPARLFESIIAPSGDWDLVGDAVSTVVIQRRRGPAAGGPSAR